MTGQSSFSGYLVQRRALASDLAQQRASFALGNGNFESEVFSRAAVTTKIFPRQETRADASEFFEPRPSLGNAQAELDGILRQYDLAVEIIFRHTAPDPPRFLLSREIILQLQETLTYPGGPQAGYRELPVRIETKDFEPIEPAQVPAAVEELCECLNSRWDGGDALELAAYVLWRLNWIHPFIDGNGRTARALSYIILSIKLGTVLPGSPTIPEQLAQQRAEYYDALAAADEAYRELCIVNVEALKSLLGTMLVRQLEAVPALSPEDLANVQAVINKRLGSSPSNVVSQVFAEGAIESRLWSIGDHIALQIGSASAILQAESMLNEYGSPFPRLLAIGVRGSRLIKEGQRGLILRDELLNASDGCALALERNAGVVIERPRVQWSEFRGSSGSWELKGVLYVVRLGRQITVGRVPETFDLLLARHLATLR